LSALREESQVNTRATAHDDEFTGLHALVAIVGQVNPHAAQEINECGKRAIKYEHYGQYGDAAEEYLAMLEFAPEVFEVYRYVALELIVFGSESEAIDTSYKAIELDPSKPSGHELLGEVYYTLKRYNKARAALRQATLLGTENYDTYLLLGNSCLAVEQYEAAIKAYSKALLYRPEDWYALSYLGRAYYEAGKYQEALSAITKCLEIGEDGNGQVLQLLGDIYNSLGRFPEAISAYKQSIEINPRPPDWHLKLAQAFKSSGQIEEANKSTQRSEELLLEAERESLHPIPF
jgi:tetratricopeptide (TPR) repeat protein